MTVASTSAAAEELSISWRPEAIRFSQDPVSGAEVEQLTSDAVISTNIYPERRFASADGSRIAISRHPFNQPSEIWVCDMNSLRLCRIGPLNVTDGNAPLNAVYYIDHASEAARLIRLDLIELSTQVLFEFDELRSVKKAVVSVDEKYVAVGPHLIRDNLYAIKRIDLATGRVGTLFEMEDMFNPHLQFNPAGGYQLIVQVDRGGRPAGSDGRRGEIAWGRTLYVVDAFSGEVTPLPAGRPHTPRISGHECWVGSTGRVIFTGGQYNVTASSYVTIEKEIPETERHMPPAAIYIAKPGDETPTILAQDRLFNHLGASDDGRFFVGDDHPTGRIYVGSIATGRSLPLCDSHTRQGACQHSHVHAYMTPDNRHVIFNSVVTGVAQVYAARVPDGFLDRVLEQ